MWGGTWGTSVEAHGEILVGRILCLKDYMSWKHTKSGQADNRCKLRVNCCYFLVTHSAQC